MRDAAHRHKPASYQDLLALPPEMVGEIIAGELVVSPRPGPLHARCTSDLGGLLQPPFRFGRGGPGGWWILDEPELHLGEEVLVPDLAGWRRERMPALPETAWFESAPDWLCEVLSPSTARSDRLAKMRSYGRAGVGQVWLIDPVARSLEVYRLTEMGWLFLPGDPEATSVRAAPSRSMPLSST